MERPNSPWQLSWRDLQPLSPRRFQKSVSLNLLFAPNLLKRGEGTPSSSALLARSSTLLFWEAPDVCLADYANGGGGTPSSAILLVRPSTPTSCGAPKVYLTNSATCAKVNGGGGGGTPSSTALMTKSSTSTSCGAPGASFTVTALLVFQQHSGVPEGLLVQILFI